MYLYQVNMKLHFLNGVDGVTSILADCLQHVFRSHRSCKTQLVHFVHDIISNLDGAVNRGHRQRI